jgi:hypothetical protein
MKRTRGQFMINFKTKVCLSLFSILAMNVLLFGLTTPVYAVVETMLKEHSDINEPKYPTPNYGTGDQKQLIAKGEYLVKAGDCLACHTVDKSKPFAGGS